MSNTAYTIDGTAVNTRTDWRHDVLPGPAQGRIEYQSPGIRMRVVVKGPDLPNDIEIVGYLIGTGATRKLAIAALDSGITTFKRMMGGTATHLVDIYGQSFPDCELMEFAPGGDMQAVAVAGSYRVIRLVKFRWRQLK